jgi:nitrite reductase/ring-hydroxylating ferredoxin subunit
MDLPTSVAALEDRLGRDGDFVADPDLVSSPEVLAAERQRIFMRPLVAVDHASRLAEDGRFFHADAGGRSIVVTRDDAGCLHALRNVCLHAGYPVCDAEHGLAERLVCPYHGWEYALDGRLVEPDLSARIDPARLQLARYSVAVCDGLIVVDLSSGPDAAPPAVGVLPRWLADAEVVRRARWSTVWNWKLTLQFLRSSPQFWFDDAVAEDWHGLGPLSLVLLRPDRAALVNVIPKFAERTDFQLVEMAAAGAPSADTALADRVGGALDRAAADGPPSLDRPFLAWYWSLMAAG